MILIIRMGIRMIFTSKDVLIDSESDSTSTSESTLYVKATTNPAINPAVRAPNPDISNSTHHIFMILELGLFFHSVPLVKCISGLLAFHICCAICMASINQILE